MSEPDPAIVARFSDLYGRKPRAAAYVARLAIKRAAGTDSEDIGPTRQPTAHELSFLTAADLDRVTA